MGGDAVAIPLCGTFHYVAVIPDGFRPGESTVPAQDGSAMPELRRRRHLGDEPLLGVDPTLSIRDGRLVITASGPQGARVAAASFRVVADLMKTLRCGDVLRLVRVGSGDVGLAILREDRLLVAIGAASAVPLGPGVSVRAHPSAGPAEGVTVTVDGETGRLGAGTRGRIGEYTIDVLRPAMDGLPGHSESVAICRAGTCSLEAAVRSARLLDQGLDMVRWEPVRPEGGVLLELWRSGTANAVAPRVR
jgi:hypothetical protein